MIEDSVPQGYQELDDIGVRKDDISIHIPEDLNRKFIHSRDVAIKTFLLKLPVNSFIRIF